MSDELTAKINRIESILTASLMVQIQELQEVEGKTRKKPLSIEAILYKAGIESPTEIGSLVNKTKQAVSNRLTAEGVR